MRRSTDMGDSMNTSDTSITRRQLLKRGAAIGGAVLWATPVVQVVGMGKAYAQDVSPNCSRFCLKWEVDENHKTGSTTCTDGGAHALPIWSNRWSELGSRRWRDTVDSTEGVDDAATSESVDKSSEDDSATTDHFGGHSGTILDCPRGCSNSGSSARQLTRRRHREFVVYGSKGSGFWVSFPPDVKPAELADEGLPTAAVKCGQGTKKLKQYDLSFQDDPCFNVDGVPYKRVFIPDCGNGRDISHIELIVDWCPGKNASS